MPSLDFLVARLENELVSFLNANSIMQLSLLLGILVFGVVVAEIVHRRFVKSLDRSDEKTEKRKWHLSGATASFRLVLFAGVIRLAELPVQLSQPQQNGFQFLEYLLLAAAVLVFMFHLVNLLNQLPTKLPDPLQDDSTSRYLARIRFFLKLSILVAVIVGFVYFQKLVFQAWLSNSNWWRYVVIVILVVMLWTIGRIISGFLIRFREVQADSKEIIRLQLTLSSFLWPIRLLIIAVIIYTLKIIFNFSVSGNHFLDQVNGVIGVVALFLLVFKLLDLVEYELNQYVVRDDNLLDKSFVQMMRLVMRFVVIIVAAIYLIQTISGKPVSALLAGLGIGALAIALAAQDTLKNLFGSIMIMVDKPFTIGQRIQVDSVDGVVETVGFRSTRVRTLAGHQVTVPNEKMANSSVENIARRPHIRRMSNLGITYDTPPDKVEKAIQLIKEILENHEGMHPDFPPRVFFEEFNDFSLNIKMIYWYHPGDYYTFAAFSERINLQIMRAFEKEGIEFAFPTSTTYLAQDEKRRLNIVFEQEPND
jgi:MscS family membrane protein